MQKEEAKLQRFGVFDDADTAFLARLPYAENSIAILDLAQQQQRGLAEVGAAYFALSEKLSMGWLYRAIAALPRHNQWQNQACLAVREDIQTLHLLATEKWLTSDGNAEARAGLESILDKAGQQISAMQAYEQTDLAMLSALARSLLRLLA